MPEFDSPIAILGFGRFGRALAERIIECGLAARAVDPHADIDLVPAAGSLAELTDGAELVVLATPVAAARDALTALRPHVNSDHLVIDVASVKAGPVGAMTDILAADIPWIATHPLFGPASIARAESLRAVVCPNDIHPDATQRATEFYEHLGCEVTRQSADEHDRTMARTHALAFFVAKAMLDIGAGQDGAPAPPSFNAMAQTINTVRADAGHLFYAIQHDNPHAADARQNLIDSLRRVHDDIGSLAPPDDRPGTAPSLAIAPPDDTPTPDLIDEIDAQIAELLARREQIARRAVRFRRDP